MRFVHPKYFFPHKFLPKSRCGFYANAGYTPLSTVYPFIDGSRSLGLLSKGKTCIIAKFHKTDLVICSYSRKGKTPSYS